MGAKVQGAVLPVHPGAGDFQRLVRDLQPDIPLRHTGEDYGSLQRCDHISGTAGLLCCQKTQVISGKGTVLCLPFWRDSHERIYKKQLEVSAFCFKQRIDRRILYRIISTGNVFAGDAAAITGTGYDH